MKFFYTVVFLFVGFLGGMIAPLVASWIKPTFAVQGSDALSIANTYIVFTTIIFVGFTVVMGVGSYAFAQMFAKSKDAHEKLIFDGLRERISNDDKTSIQLLNSVIDNPAVAEKLAEILTEKVDNLMEQAVADSEECIVQANAGSKVINELKNKISNGNTRKKNGDDNENTT